MKSLFIAEVKTQSPFGFKSTKTWNELFDLANEYGDMLSIHTDPRWGGSFELLKEARRRTSKSILAKGIHEHDVDVERAFDLGADYVLVVGRVPEMRTNCLIEPMTITELSNLPYGISAVWNSRDLLNGELKTETFAAARIAFGGWLCQASNIKTLNDVDPNANAILVGTHLEQFINSL